MHHVKEFGPRLVRELVGPWLVERELSAKRDVPSRGEEVASDPEEMAPPSGADTIPAYDLGTLGERCVALCLAQMRLANPPLPRHIAEWLRLSVGAGRRIRGPGTSDVALASLNFCAAAQSAALAAVANDTDELPHEARAGVVELVSDALKRSRWHEVSEVHAGVWTPQIGDLCVYDRLVKGRPETAW